jgi:3-deoxy-D-manno-octulosonic-acid transferase
MNFYLFAYNLLVSGLALFAFPFVWAFARKDETGKAALAQRLGYQPAGHGAAHQGCRCLWIHAVSVGEVKAADAIVDALAAIQPELAFLVTTTTATGQRYAQELFSNRATVRYAPIDLWWSTRRFLNIYRPDMLAIMETEIWPNWIASARKIGISVVFLNGRISARSICSYLKIRPLIKPLLAQVNAFSMISEQDAHRVRQLGAPANRVTINGNVKMDIGNQPSDDSLTDGLMRLFSLNMQTPVFVAGSIRGAELGILIDVCERLISKLPELVIILAPRHIENANQIAQLASQRNMKWQYRSRLSGQANGRYAPIVILDTIGELRHVYCVASVVFCGASLVPLGGQNVLEAAVWAKPVLYGPYMDDFEDARLLLEEYGGGMSVTDGGTLTGQALRLLTRPDEANRLGRLARCAVMASQGAARRHAQVVLDQLSKGR